MVATVVRRRRIFVGVEGESERSFAAWLKLLCDNEDLHVHLDVRVCSGGDSLAIVQSAERQYDIRTRTRGRFSAGLVFLDSDRLQQDIAAGRDPTGVGRLMQIYLKPNLEGLLLRLYAGEEAQNRSAGEVKRVLKRRWPDYDKPPAARLIARRFSLTDLRRAARHDSVLRLLLEQLGLLNK